MELGVLLVLAMPPAAFGLLVPPMPSSAWNGQHHEGCGGASSSSVRTRLWAAHMSVLGRPPECTAAVMTKSPAQDEPRQGGTEGRGKWGLSAWVSGAKSVSSRLALPGLSRDELGAGWFSGGIWGAGGNNNNGTDTRGPGGHAMDDGDGEEAGVDLRCAWKTEPPPTDYGAISPKSSGVGPWVWLSALWGVYAVWLRTAPMVTKAVTSGVLALTGDIAAQCFEYQQNDRLGPAISDARRLMAVAIDSMLISGPALHVLYGLMEHIIPTKSGGFLPATAHVLLDTFVFDPAFVVSFFCVTGMLERRSLRGDVLPALRRDFWPAVRASWVVSLCFCPAQYITFRYLPIEFRVLSVNVCDIIWTSVLSYFSHKGTRPDHARPPSSLPPCSGLLGA